MHAVGRESLILRRERNGRKRIGVDDDDGAALDSTRGKDDAHGWCPFSTARVKRSCDARTPWATRCRPSIREQSIRKQQAPSTKHQAESPVGLPLTLSLSLSLSLSSVISTDWEYERTQARKSDPSRTSRSASSVRYGNLNGHWTRAWRRTPTNTGTMLCSPRHKLSYLAAE